MTASIEIWDEGFNIFEVQQTTDTVLTHTATTVNVAGTPWTNGQWIGYSIKFTSGALNGNGYVITGNDENTITCVDADFTSLVDGETFKIITTGKELSSTNAPVSEVTLDTEKIQTVPQSYNYGWDDSFTLDDTGAPVSEVTLDTEEIQTVPQSYNYGWDDSFTLDDTGAPVSEVTLDTEEIQTVPQSYNYGWDDSFTLDDTGSPLCFIKGNVKNDLGYNIEGVTIILVNSESYTTTTDANGNYSQPINPNVYTVTASLSGHNDESASVDASSSDQTQNFVLDRNVAPICKGIRLRSRYLLN